MIDREVNAVVLWLSSFKKKRPRVVWDSSENIVRLALHETVTHYIMSDGQSREEAQPIKAHLTDVWSMQTSSIINGSLSLWGTLLLLLPLQDWNRTWDKIKTDRRGGGEGIQIVGWFWIFVLLLGCPHLNHSRVGCAPIVSIICQIRPCPISIIPPSPLPLSPNSRMVLHNIDMGPLHFTILCTNYVLLTLVRV